MRVSASPEKGNEQMFYITLSKEEAQLLQKLLGQIGGGIGTDVYIDKHSISQKMIAKIRNTVTDPLCSKLSCWGCHIMLSAMCKGGFPEYCGVFMQKPDGKTFRCDNPIHKPVVVEEREFEVEDDEDEESY